MGGQVITPTDQPLLLDLMAVYMHAAVLMKNYAPPDYPIVRSFEESQEVQYLGEEFGEV
jgi:hypothetical protein